MSDSNHLMKGGNLVQVLAESLNPSTTNNSYQTLSNLRSNNGFAIELLVISDDANYNNDIRLSALIYLKNILQDHLQAPFIPEEDISTIKASLLQALIRNVTNVKLTPTFREIIFMMAEKYYPRQWPQIVKDSIAIVEKSTDLGGLLGGVQALKAVYSVFGGSISKEIELNNLCNKTLIPLLNLASKLFQNFNEQTSYVLVCIFKLLFTSITFYLPQMIQLNIHSLMIFIKKILDLTIDLSAADNTNLYLLKRISLKIVFKMYQKHANMRITENKDFARGFQDKYTKSLLQTLIMQIMLPLNGEKTAKHRSLELCKIAFASLAYINRENKEAAMLLLQNKESLLKLCMQKFRTSLTRNYSSFTEFKLYIQENRSQMKQFVFSLLNCDAIPEHQTDTASSILGLLLQYLQKGDDEQKELSLYLFTEIAGELKYLTDKLDQKMIMLIMNYARPLLKQGNLIMIRARACELISRYNYLDFPEDQMTEMANLIYGCLLTGKGDKETFLKIYACHAFNSIMKYDSIAEFIKPYIPDILAIYTDLLQADTSIIKNFEDLINLLEEEIAPFANDLVKMLINMFLGYIQSEQPVNRGYKQKEEDDEEGELQEQQTNNQLNARACISSIRQILQSSTTVLTEQNKQSLFDIVVWIFSDANQNYIQQGYNVLNLLLYKADGQADSKYFLFFKVIVYAILGLPKEYVQNLVQKGDEFSVKYAAILNNICLEPDNDIIQNSIGCLRNFIAKSSGDFLRNQRDDFNNSSMDYLFKVVKVVHQCQDRKSSQTDRLIVLTIYISLIEYRRVNQEELREIISSVLSWMQMEQEVAEAEFQKNKNSPFGLQKNGPKYIYSSVYEQIILLAINFYEKVAIDQVNINSIIAKLVQLADSFKCDYELSRIILGLSYILDNQLLGDEALLRTVLEALPELVRRLCKSRQEGDDNQNDLNMDDEAEEERDDENTHMMGWKQRGGNVTNKDLMLRGEEEDDDLDWQEEFNKFYLSPLDQNDQLTFLGDVMKRMGHVYGQYMSQSKQEELSLYLSNAPPKNNPN